MTGVDRAHLAWLLAIDGLDLLGGIGALVAIGFIRSRTELVVRGGVALLLGMLVSGILEAHLALVGVPLSFAVVVVINAVLIAIGARAWRRSDRAPDAALPRRASALIAPAALAVTAVQFAHIAATAAVRPMLEWDSWAIWGFKARALTTLGSAVPGVFASLAYQLPHLDYPILQPVLEAQPLRDGWDPGMAHLQLVVLAGACLWAVVGLCHGRIPLEVPSLAVLFLATQPWFVNGLLSGFADVPVAVVASCALVALLRFAIDGDRRVLALGALFAGGAGLIKNEGSMFVITAFVAVALMLLAARRPGELKPLGVALAGVLALWLPWRLYVALHSLPSNDYKIGSVLHPSYLQDQWGRVDPATRALWSHVQPGGLLAPATLLAVGLVAALLARRFALGLAIASWSILSFAGLVVIFWISIVSVQYQIATAADRVVTTLLVGGVVAGAFGAGEALRDHVLARAEQADVASSPGVPAAPLAAERASV